MSMRGTARAALLASWSAAVRDRITPTMAVLAGGLLELAGGNATRAIAKLEAMEQYLELVENEDRERARRTG